MLQLLDVRVVAVAAFAFVMALVEKVRRQIFALAISIDHDSLRSAWRCREWRRRHNARNRFGKFAAIALDQNRNWTVHLLPLRSMRFDVAVADVDERFLELLSNPLITLISGRDRTATDAAERVAHLHT
jgi:hypothetical protein